MSGTSDPKIASAQALKAQNAERTRKMARQAISAGIDTDAFVMLVIDMAEEGWHDLAAYFADGASSLAPGENDSVACFAVEHRFLTDVVGLFVSPELVAHAERRPAGTYAVLVFCQGDYVMADYDDPYGDEPPPTIH